MPDAVYISSTYEDLKEFRQAVIHCVQSLSDHYTPVGMEFYQAEMCILSKNALMM
jgi:hypothetical protein